MTSDHEDTKIPVRVRVGVTGHRALSNEAAVRERVREALDWIRARAGIGADLPVLFTVVSPLAEGADRVVAQEVLEYDKGADLEAPLPLRQDDYERDFKHPSSLREFRDLVEDKRTRTTVVSERERPDAYGDVGRFVVDNVDILIAVWDGQRAHGPGGTAEIVRFAKRRCPTIVITPDGSAITWPKRRFRNEQMFYNTRFVAAADLEAAAVTELKYLPVEALSSLRADGLAEWIVPRYVRADILALRYQGHYYDAGNLVFFSAAFAVIVAASQAIFGFAYQWVWLELGFIAVGPIVVLVSSRLRFRQRFLAYRSLAERFRSALYLAAAGVDATPEDDATLSQVGDARDTWIVDTSHAIWSRRPPVELEPAQTEILRSLLAEAWIGGQRAYHERAGLRYRTRERRTGIVVLAAIGVVFAIGVLHAAGVGGEGTTARWFGLIAIALPVLAAALSGRAEQREFRRHAERYKRMVPLLDQIQADTNRAGDLDGLRQCALHADAVMRHERQDWFGVMILKDIKPAP